MANNKEWQRRSDEWVKTMHESRRKKAIKSAPLYTHSTRKGINKFIQEGTKKVENPFQQPE